MALFSLTDIKIKSNERTGQATDSLVGGVYESNVFRYPMDLGNYDKGHYMVIHINEQVRTQSPGALANEDPTIISNRKKYGTIGINTNIQEGVNMIGNIVKGGNDSKDKKTGFLTSSGIGDVLEQAGNFAHNAGSVLGVRTIRRTTDTIALYMPDTMNFVNSQHYSDLTIGLPGQLLAAGVSTAQELKSQMSNPSLKQLTQNLSPFVASLMLNKTDIGKVITSSALGVVQNPMLELLYTSPAFRTFRFDFMFYPRSEKEAEEVIRIIDRLRFHQAPEIHRKSNGFFLVPPSEFDIKFMCNGQENQNIPQISTCILDTIDIDYAPQGFSAYEVPGQLTSSKGGTGMPVAIRMSLNFKETELMTKDNFSERAGRFSAIKTEEYSKSVYAEKNSNGEGIY